MPSLAEHLQNFIDVALSDTRHHELEAPTFFKPAIDLDPRGPVGFVSVTYKLLHDHRKIKEESSYHVILRGDESELDEVLQSLVPTGPQC